MQARETVKILTCTLEWGKGFDQRGGMNWHPFNKITLAARYPLERLGLDYVRHRGSWAVCFGGWHTLISGHLTDNSIHIHIPQFPADISSDTIEYLSLPPPRLLFLPSSLPPTFVVCLLRASNSYLLFELQRWTRSR